ncbi:MAG: CHRD domain-containing protein [Syntrophales bacterium]
MNKTRVQFMVFWLVILAASFGLSAESNFTAKLSGKEVVPPVKTKARGEAKFQLAKDGNAMSYQLTVKNIENVTAAHIHSGAKGTNGPPVVNLFTGPKKEGKFSGKLSEGTITADNLAGSLKGKTIGDLVQMIRAGNAYVNVHTDKYPDGEIRGQIK